MQVAESAARQFAVTIPELKQTSYQSFDDKGGYSFGYAFPEQMHTETRSADGEVTGSYCYRDPNGNSNQVLLTPISLFGSFLQRVGQFPVGQMGTA